MPTPTTGTEIVDQLPGKPTLRSRLPLWGGLLALVLLFPVVVIPLLLAAFRESAFRSVDEVNAADVKAIELFVLNRPDRGPDIGAGTRFVVPPADFERTLALLRHAKPVDAATARGIWLGQVVVVLKDGRSQSVLLHRPKDEYNTTAVHRVELRIGSHQFEGPPVDELTRQLGEIAGVAPPPGK